MSPISWEETRSPLCNYNLGEAGGLMSGDLESNLERKQGLRSGLCHLLDFPQLLGDGARRGSRWPPLGVPTWRSLPGEGGLSRRHLGASPSLTFAATVPLDGLQGSVLGDPLEKLCQRAEQDAEEGGWALSPSNAPEGRASASQGVRPGRRAKLPAPPVARSGGLSRRRCGRKRDALNLR